MAGGMRPTMPSTTFRTGRRGPGSVASVVSRSVSATTCCAIGRRVALYSSSSGVGPAVEHGSSARRPGRSRPGCRGSCPARRPGCARGRRRRRAASGLRGRCRRRGGGSGTANPRSTSVTVRPPGPAVVEELLDELERSALPERRRRARRSRKMPSGSGATTVRPVARPEQAHLVGGRVAAAAGRRRARTTARTRRRRIRCRPARARCCACRRRRRRSGLEWCRRRRTSR